MCNHFGECKGYPLSRDAQEFAEIYYRDKSHFLQSQAYKDWLERAIRYDTTPNESQGESRSKRLGWLTQEEIDSPLLQDDRPPVVTWFEAIPGLFLTILVLAAFVAGCWGIMLLWEMR